MRSPRSNGIMRILAALAMVVGVILPLNTVRAAATPIRLGTETNDTAAPTAHLPAVQPLVWSQCDDATERECSTLTVPLDYNNPGKGSLHLPVARAKATSERIGVLLFNLGGPGVSQVSTLKSSRGLRRLFAPDLLARFDVIAMDPRGTTNGISCLTSGEQEQYWETSHIAKTYSQLDQILDLERSFNQACFAKNAQSAPYVNSASSIRDMEMLRRALGEEQFSFLGFSYGTFVGYRYANLFPGHIRAMVLDSPVDKSRDDFTLFRESIEAYDGAWSRFKAWCQDAASNCSLRGQNIDVITNALLAQARSQPITVKYALPGFSRRPVNDWVLTIALQAAAAPGAVTYGWVDSIIAQARSGDASLARTLYDNATGYYYGAYPEGEGEGTHRTIWCEDTIWSRALTSRESVNAATLLAVYSAPRFGEANVMQGPAQCFGLPAPSVEPPPVASKMSGPPVLVVTATEDAVSPPIWGDRILAKMPAGSSMLRVQGPGHVSYNKSSCAFLAVNSYLLTGQIPTQPASCAQDNNPVQPVPDLSVFGEAGATSAAPPQTLSRASAPAYQLPEVFRTQYN